MSNDFKFSTSSLGCRQSNLHQNYRQDIYIFSKHMFLGKLNSEESMKLQKSTPKWPKCSCYTFYTIHISTLPQSLKSRLTLGRRPHLQLHPTWNGHGWGVPGNNWPDGRESLGWLYSYTGCEPVMNVPLVRNQSVNESYDVQHISAPQKK